jgi:hypothetical protein
MGTDPLQDPGSGETCARCGDPIGPGTALYSDRVRAADGQLRCAECNGAERGAVDPVMDRPDVPITMPNTNMPNTH